MVTMDYFRTGEFYVPTALLDWFNDNYIENREECAKLVVKGMIEYPFTPEQLKNGCEKLKKTELENQSLATHIKLIGGICNIGVSAWLKN